MVSVLVPLLTRTCRCHLQASLTLQVNDVLSASNNAATFCHASAERWLINARLRV